MKKSDAIKTVICIFVFTLIFGTTVMAGTVTRSAKVRGTNYTDSYTGSYGNYVASGDNSQVRTSVQSTASSNAYFACYVKRYNYSSGKYDLSRDTSKALANGATNVAVMARSKDSYVYDYVHHAAAYASPTGTSSTMVDSYTFTAKQYYD